MVIGCVLISIGLTLIPIGINNFAGGSPATNPEFGSGRNLALGFTVFFISLFLQRFGKGIWKLSALLIAMVIGYIIAGFMGIVDLSEMATASWVTLPIPWYLRPEFSLSAIGSFVVVFFISGLSTIGYTNSIAAGGFDRRPTSEEVSGAIVNDALSSAFAAVFNCLPSTEFGQNAGLVAMTRIVNRWVFSLTAFTLIIAGLFPRIGVLFANIPPAVLGGGIIMVFAMILTNGMQMIASDGFTNRNLSVLCVVFGIGLGLGGNMDAIVSLPGWLHFLVGDRIAFVAVVAILTNMFFPRDKTVAEEVTEPGEETES